MSKLNTIGLGVLCAYALLLGVASTGCCGGGSSAATAEAGSASGDSSSSSKGGSKSCDDMSSLSQCSEFTNKSMKLLGEDFYKGMCELTSGKWGEDACPTENVVGTCDDGEGSVTIYYSNGGSPYDATTAREACEFLDGAFKS